MKLGLVAHGLSTQGGIESVCWHLAAWSAKAGHDVTVFAGQAPSPLPKGVKLVPVRLPRLPWALKQFAFALASARAVERHPVEVLEAHVNTFAPAEIMVCHSVHPIGSRLVRGLDPNPFRRAWHWLKSLAPLVDWLSGWNYRNPKLKAAVATSTGIGRELLSLYPQLGPKMARIHNGFDPAQRHPATAAQRRRLRKGFGLGPKDRALLFIGKEFHRKGLESVIRALALLPESCSLWVIGNNVDTVPTSHYEALVAGLGLGKRVKFLGHQSQLLPFYQAADAFVFPTLYEAFAMVTIESLACGLPLLAMKTNGTEDIIEPGRNGAFVERRGASVAEAVKKYVLPEKVRARLSRGALKTARNFTWKKIAAQHLALCKKAAASR